MSTPPIPWRRLVAEALLILASVYLAIFLEGVSTDRARHAEARAALTALSAELAQDRADLDEILRVQRNHGERYERTIRWLGTPQAMPVDSFAGDLQQVVNYNRTVFPRRSSWNTMVAGGQLPFLDDPTLVVELADFYENLNARVEHNGANYGVAVEDVARNSAAYVWDRVEGGLLTRDPIRIRAFRGQLAYLSDWNRFYVDLLEEWRGDLERLISAVARFHDR